MASTWNAEESAQHSMGKANWLFPDAPRDMRYET